MKNFYFLSVTFLVLCGFVLLNVKYISAGTLTCTVRTTSCNGGEVAIFNMAATTNSHAELATSSNYTNLVCCGGVTGLGNSCNGSFATVLKLSATTNAHVSQSNGAYNQSVCLKAPAGGTASAGFVSGSCAGFDTTLASMQATDNSHVGDGSAYNTKICGTAAAAASLTFVVDSATEAFTNVSPGSVSATTTILTVTTSNALGFVISTQRSDVTGTMSLGSTYIPDKTDWSSPGATTTPGNATASTTQPQTLQFRVRQAGTDAADYASTWWGANDTTASALFGGISSTTQTIINRSIAAGSGTTAYVLYNVNVPATQQTGTYSGSITYTATAN